MCTNEDLLRDKRKKFNAMGKSVLLFRYRDDLCCIESRSPAGETFSEVRRAQARPRLESARFQGFKPVEEKTCLQLETWFR